MPVLLLRGKDGLLMFEFNPLADPRWDRFIERHPNGGLFHASPWLQALHDTYQYRATAFTTSTPGAPITNGLLLCEVKSWLTGRRLVSLPFSDHCDVLYDSTEDAQSLFAWTREWMDREECRYVEFRPSGTDSSFMDSGMVCSDTYMLHTLSLEMPIDEIFRNLHKDCIQRKIRRAERESLKYVKGRSELLLRQFYQLLLRTRRRHSLPPQPFTWFRNLSTCLGDRMAVRVAYQGTQPIAAMITLDFKDTVTYKYGCSDERFSNLGGTPFLFWKVIEESKNAGMRNLDLGRTDLDNLGLATFKDRLGAQRQPLHYYRITRDTNEHDVRKSWVAPLVRKAFPYIPDSLLVASGKLLYRHIG